MKKRVSEDTFLPASSSNEDLETISRNKVSLLFDVGLFEIRQETQRDKGIDLIVELKQDSYYTNFRFAVQLKSTRSIRPNKDKSVSFPIELSNINYLLNYGMPAYYILYEHTEEKFYIEQVNHVYSSVIKKHKAKKLPKQYNVRFSKLLTPEAIGEMYQRTLDSGNLLRRLNSHLNLSHADSQQSSGIVIDNENEVYSVEQNIAFIDQFGFDLLNRGDFARIIEIEQRTHPRTSASPIFNFVCGMAYYQRSNLFKTLDLLKLAQHEASSFSSEIQSLLTYTLIHAKYLLGMVDEKTFKAGIGEIMNANDLGSFLHLEKVYSEFQKSNDSDRVRLEILYKKTEHILAEDSSNHHALIVAYARLLSAEQIVLVHDLSKNMVYTCGRVKDYTKTKTYLTWKSLESLYTQRLNDLFQFTFKQEAYLSMGNVAMDKIKWIYSKIFLHRIFANWNSASLVVDGPVSETDLQILKKSLVNLDRVVEGCKSLNHFENMALGLSLKYELLHFMGAFEEARATSMKIIAIIEAYDLNGMKNNFNKLLDGGTSHERYLNSFTAHLNRIYQTAKACGLEEFMSGEIPEEMLPFTEQEIKWSIDTFFEFKFPTSTVGV